MAQVCLACFGSNLTVENGVLVCEDCGTQCSAQVEEAEYEEVGGAGVSKRRAAGSSKAVPRSFVLDKEMEPDEARSRMKAQGRAYLQCLQHVLQAQADALVLNMKVIPEIHPLIRHIWLSLIPHLRCLDFELLQSEVDVDHDLESDPAEDEDAAQRERTHFSISGRRQPGVSVHKRANREKVCRRLDPEQLDNKLISFVTRVTPIVQAFSTEISLQTTLSICILACIILRQPITPFDVLRWALDGQLPFLDAGQRCQHLLQALDPLVAAPLHALLQPPGAGPATSLLVSAVELSSMLGLQLPNVNGPLLLYKACCELALPEEVFLVGMELHDLLLQDSPLMSPSSMSSSHHPYCLIVSVAATATCLCYGLDGSEMNAPHFSDLPPQPASAALNATSPACPLGSADRPVELDQEGIKGSAGRPAGPEQELPAGAGHGSDPGQAGAKMHEQHTAVWRQAGVEATLPPSRATMMLNSLQQQQQQQQQQQPLVTDTAAKSIKAQQATEEEVAARTGSIRTSGWLDWAHARMQEHTRPHSYPASVDEACRLLGPELASYLRYCKEVVFGGSQPPPGLSDLSNLLERMAGLDARTDGHLGLAAAVQTEHGLASSMDAREEGCTQLQSHMRQEAAGVGATSGSHQEQNEEAPAAAAAAAAAGDLVNWARVHSQPHVYTSIPMQMMSSETHHPDLLALAAACGAVVDVHPDVILRQVSALQQKLVEVEKRL